MIWLLGGYMVLFIHRPFEVWPVLGSLRIERVYMLATIGYWLLAVEKHWIPNHLNKAFFLFAVAMVACFVASPLKDNSQPAVEEWFKLAVFFVLVVSTVRDEESLKKLVIMFLCAMAVLMLHSLFEFRAGKYQVRMGVVRMIAVNRTHGDPNAFAAHIVYSLTLLFPLWFEYRKPLARWLMGGYLVLAICCTVLTASRGGFVALCALGLLASMFSKHRVRFLVMLALALPIGWAMIPEKLQNRFETLIDPSKGPADAQASAEGRLKGFEEGLKLWQQSPICGFGPGTFAHARRDIMQLQAHNLYGQVLGEMGTIGAVALLAVVLAFCANGFRYLFTVRGSPALAGTFAARVVQSVSLTVCLLLLMGFGGHNLYRFTWLWFGAFEIIAIHCLKTHQEDMAEVEEEAVPAAEYAWEGAC